ncbi:MAG TPA: hypothetical protein PLN52_21780 [Opitutaceae bacterium]|nr:hypothetical protein [Opitutaceae bacterium]
MLFELYRLAADPGTETALRSVRGSQETLTLALPPVLANPDVVRVRPLSKGFWPFSSGNETTTSDALLTLKPEAASRLHNSRRGVFAVVIDGQVTGRMIIPQPLQGHTLPITGAFSDREARDLAQEIKLQVTNV